VCWIGGRVELTGIIAGLLLAIGGLVAGVGLVLHAWVAGRPDLPGVATRLSGWPGRTGRGLGHRADVREPDQRALVATLILGLAVVALAAVGVGALVDDVTDGDGVAVLDHPVAGFVAAHRALALRAVMRAVSGVGGPAGMTVIAVAMGVLLGVAWRSWTPAMVLMVTDAGVVGLTVVFKAVLGRARPPLAQAVAAADGYGFPSGHAAAAAAVCGAAAWLCTIRMRSWRGRIAVWTAAAMVAALVGISRVYLGVHWMTDVIGGWAFGIMWLAVVVSGWTAFGRVRRPGR
jgi:membrane-associated phospholipid phosphatase